jgi:biopolymer transport protein ExbD
MTTLKDFNLAADRDEDGPLHVAPKPKLDEEIDITPMIDMVFLLLIFFIVASKPDGRQANEIPKAEHGTAVASKDAIVINLKHLGGGRAQVYSKSGTNFSPDPEQQEAELVDFITRELEQGDRQVVLRAESDVRFGEVQRVNRAIGIAFPDLNVIYLAVRQPL